jgi:hypothetical protein
VVIEPILKLYAGLSIALFRLSVQSPTKQAASTRVKSCAPPPVGKNADEANLAAFSLDHPAIGHKWPPVLLFWIALSGPFQSQLDRLKAIDQPRYSSCHGVNLTTVSGDCFVGCLVSLLLNAQSRLTARRLFA